MDGLRKACNSETLGNKKVPTDCYFRFVVKNFKKLFPTKKFFKACFFLALPLSLQVKWGSIVEVVNGSAGDRLPLIHRRLSTVPDWRWMKKVANVCDDAGVKSKQPESSHLKIKVKLSRQWWWPFSAQRKKGVRCLGRTKQQASDNHPTLNWMETFDAWNNDASKQAATAAFLPSLPRSEQQRKLFPSHFFLSLLFSQFCWIQC